MTTIWVLLILNAGSVQSYVMPDYETCRVYQAHIGGGSCRVEEYREI